jgi:hypothetical protein
MSRQKDNPYYEGGKAFLNKISIKSNPYQGDDGQRWEKGWLNYQEHAIRLFKEWAATGWEEVIYAAPRPVNPPFEGGLLYAGV